MDIKRFVAHGNTVLFNFFRQGHFHYSVQDFETGKWFDFQIPLEDIGTATMEYSDKAITYMRWIRKAIADGTLIENKEKHPVKPLWNDEEAMLKVCREWLRGYNDPSLAATEMVAELIEANKR